MKRKKNLIILAGIFAVLCIVIGAEFAYSKHEEKINNTDKEILAIEADEVTEVSWTYEKQTLDFKKKDGSWYSTDDEAFPVNQDKIKTLLNEFDSVHASFEIDDVEDFGQYGLDNPTCTLTFSTKDGEKTISMGDFSTMDSKRYVTLGKDKVYLVDSDPVEQMTSNRDDYMQQDEFGGFEDVNSFKVTGSNKLNIIFDNLESYTYSNNYSYYLVDGDDHKALSSDLTEEYMNNIMEVDMTDYVTYNATKNDLSDYNLDDPLMTIEVKGTKKEDSSDESTVVSDETSSETDTEATEADDDSEKVYDAEYKLLIGKKGKKYYATKEGSTIIYNLDSEIYSALKKGSYNTLRPTEVVSLDWSKVSSLKFTIGDKDYTIDVSHDEDSNTFKWKDKEVDASTLTAAIDAMEINKFKSKDPEKEKEFSMTVTLDQEKPNTVTVDVYQYDGSNCLLVVDGENVGLMSRSLMSDTKEAIQSIILD